MLLITLHKPHSSQTGTMDLKKQHWIIQKHSLQETIQE